MMLKRNMISPAFAVILLVLLVGCPSPISQQSANSTSQQSASPTCQQCTSISMIDVTGGTFYNGAANMTVSSFQMATYDVTQAQYLAVMGFNPSYFTGNLSRPVDQISWYSALLFCNELSLKEGLTPVYTINGSTNPTAWGAVSTTANNPAWDAATMNLNANGYRLPTEAEWMWAAMGGHADSIASDVSEGVNSRGYTKTFAGYNGSNAIGDYAWYSANSNGMTHPVGTKLPNELGLYDMSGNVWQWCWDWLGNLPDTAQTNYTGAASGTSRVAHGGSWLDTAADAAVAVSYESASRWALAYHFGLRVVRSLSNKCRSF
jgi:formylglycine-generating enzyme